MKINVTILIAVLVIAGIGFGGYKLMNKNDDKSLVNTTEGIKMKSFEGKVMRVFEGENIVDYNLDIPDTATTSISMDGALIRIIDKDIPYATIYMSYEGGRGFAPMDYINNIIAPHVSVLNETGTTTIGMHNWQKAESEGSEWYIGQVANDQWLMVVESKKVNHDNILKTLESVVAK